MKKQIIAIIFSLIMALTAGFGFSVDAKGKNSQQLQTEQSNVKDQASLYRNFLDNKDNG